MTKLKEKPLYELNDESLKILEREKRITYFNYHRDEVASLEISKEDLSKLPQGNSHAIVGNHLYVRGFGEGRRYLLYKENFLKNK